MWQKDGSLSACFVWLCVLAFVLEFIVCILVYPCVPVCIFLSASLKPDGWEAELSITMASA